VSSLLLNLVKIYKVEENFEEITFGDLASPVFFIKNRKYDKKKERRSWHLFWRSGRQAAVTELNPGLPGVLLCRPSDLY
jgi:hypothetical protein